jgi:sugar phosphate permease
MGLLSDVLVVRSPVHLLGCVGGAISLSFLTSVRDQQHQHTAALASLITSFNLFENGATVVIGIILCDIGKDQVANKKQKALATISGICDGIAGFGSIAGQLLVPPVDHWTGWTGVFAMFSLASIIACFPALPFTVRDIRSWM